MKQYRNLKGPFRITAALCAVALAATTALAQPPLSENKYVNDRLIAAQIGDIIRKTCPSIGARMIYAVRQAQKLESYALDAGYSKDQINDFVRSPVEKARVRAAAEAYMAANGVVQGDTESYCVLGRSEIDRKTIAGSLLFSYK
jgi:hypothetical protein